jgi:hypothetical protein
MTKQITSVSVFKVIMVVNNRYSGSDYTKEEIFHSRAQAEAEIEMYSRHGGLVSSEIVVEQVEPKFFAHYGYSDVHPYEVIRIVSDNTIEVRAMKTEFDFSECEFIPGGFSAHCPNPSAQKVKITSNENAPIERIRRGKRGWQQGKYMKFGITEQPSAHYDVNF